MGKRNHWFFIRLTAVVMGVFCGALFSYLEYVNSEVKATKEIILNLRNKVRKIKSNTEKVEGILSEIKNTKEMGLKLPEVSESFVSSLEARLKLNGINVRKKRYGNYIVMDIDCSSTKSLNHISNTFNSLKKGLLEVTYYKEDASGINVHLKLYMRVNK